MFSDEEKSLPVTSDIKNLATKHSKESEERN